MRAKIALIVVLASFLALSALGVTMAGAEPVAEGTTAEAPATTTTAVPSLQAPACANGLDDDGDGLTDLADPDCAASTGTSEAPVAPSDASPAAPVPAPEVPAEAPAKPKAGGIEQGSTIGGAGWRRHP